MKSLAKKISESWLMKMAWLWLSAGLREMRKKPVNGGGLAKERICNIEK